jgi:hypothetical protein
MRGTIPPLPQYAFMAWCSVDKIIGTTLPLKVKLSLCLTKHHAMMDWRSECIAPRIL